MKRFLRNVLAQLQASRKAQAATRPTGRRVRLEVEGLEDRVVPSAHHSDRALRRWQPPPVTVPVSVVSAPAVPVFELSPASSTEGNHTTDAGRVTLVGETSPNVGVNLVGTAISALSSETGRFQLPHVSLALGDNKLVVRATNAAGNSSSYSLTVTRSSSTSGRPNAVVVWNQAALAAILQDATDPLFASRGLAMVQTAIFDAVNAIDGTPAYYVKIAAPAGASAAAAVNAAAHDVLSYLYPAQQAAFDALLASQLALLPAGKATTDGVTVGRTAAAAIIAWRANDGSRNFVDFNSGTGQTPVANAPGSPGAWQPTPPAYAEPLSPQWANLTPFALASPDQFRPAGPPDLTGQQWADAFNEVKNLGKVNSTTRTADQTQIARFWNDNPGTYTPPGHWNAIAETVAQQQGDSLADDARLFAELDVSLADAGITAWNTKYHYDSVRPITVIRDPANVGNAGLQADPSWQPLINTPNFPEYISGHSTFSGAASTVLDSFFGANVGFMSTEVTLPGVMRTFTSFDQAAQEAGRSRIYGGIHFQFSNADGLAAGKAVANYVLGTFNVSQDTTPPRVTLDSRTDLNPFYPASKTNITITGQVTDNLSGVKLLEVQVDQGKYAPLSFDATTGRFAFTTSFALGGSADGPHTINFRATDAAGNVAAPVAFQFALGTKAPALTLTSPTNGGTLAAGDTLTGTATTSGPPLVALGYAFDGGTRMPVSFSLTDGSFSDALDLSRLAAGPHMLTVSAQDAAGNITMQALNLTLAAPIPLTVTSITPMEGATDVGVTFRPKVVFSRPIDPTTLTAADFYATDTTGAKLGATIVPADDGTFAWLFFTNPLPGASMITLTVDGSAIKAADGSLLDAAQNGTPGSKLTARFTTVSEASVPGTTLSGIVADPGPDQKPMTRDDIRPGPDGVFGTADDVYLRPIAGVKVFIIGHEDQAVLTDAQGRFSFTSVPVGDVKLVLEGNAPGVMTYDPNKQQLVDPGAAGFYFPEMVMDLTIQPGVANTVMGTMGSSQEQAANLTNLGVYLPRIQKSVLQTLSTTQPTTVGLTGTSGLDLTPQQQQELKLTVEPGTAIGMDGKKMTAGQVGVSMVPPDMVRDMLPPGVLQHTFDITIQAPGVATFTTPAQITFPNVFNAAPGTKLNFLSFDHTTGRLVIDGAATVSADGLTVTTDPGMGITHPGWHGLTPPGVDANSCGPPQTPAGPGPQFAARVARAASLAAPATGQAPVVLPFISSEQLGKDSGFSFKLEFDTPSAGRVDVITIKVDGPLADFMKRTARSTVPLGSQTFTLGGGGRDPRCAPRGKAVFEATPKNYDEMFASRIGFQNQTGFQGLSRDQLYGAIIHTTKDHYASDGTLALRELDTYYLYRWVDVVDARAAKAREGKSAAFLRTLADGPGGMVRTKKVDLFLPKDQGTAFVDVASQTSPAPFVHGGVYKGKAQTIWTFDPTTASGLDLDTDMPNPLRDAVNIVVVGDTGVPIATVGNLTLTGTATAPVKVNLNLDGYKAELKRVILNLRSDVIGAPNYVYYEYPSFSTTVVASASANFKREFKDFLPRKRMDPGPDGKLGDSDDKFTPAQLAQLDTFLDQEAAQLDLAVRSQYAPVNTAFVPGVQFVDSGDGDVTVNWDDVFEPSKGQTFTTRGLPVIGPVPAARPIYGVAEGDQNVAFLTFGLINLPRSRFNPPEVSQEWALAEGINDEPNGKNVTVAVAANIDWTSPKATFAQFVANSVSHELAHTFGLNEAYLKVKGGAIPKPPNDIMRNGAPKDPFLSFAPANRDTLQAAVGLEPNGDHPLAQAVKLVKKNFDLPDSTKGLPREPTTDQVPPGLEVTSAGSIVFPDDQLGVADAVAGGAFSTLDLVLTNTGSTPLAINSIALASGSQGFSIATPNVAGTALDAGQSTTLTVRFSPATAGTFQDTLTIATTDATTPAFQITLSGAGIAQAPTARLTLLNNNLGGVEPGKTADAPDLAAITNDGASPLLISAIRLTQDDAAFSLLGVPANLMAQPITLGHGESVIFGVHFDSNGFAHRAGLPGLRDMARALIDVTTNDPTQGIVHFSAVATVPVEGFHWGNNAIEIDTPDLPGAQPLRLRSDDSGDFNAFLPPNQFYHISVLDLRTGLIAHGYGTTPESGSGLDLTDGLVFAPSIEPDSAGNGLPDDLKAALGTSLTKRDTDGDGIDDFRAVQLGLDPLGGRSQPRGVAASLGVPGTANGVAVVGSSMKSEGQTGYVAAGEGGLAIVDASQPLKPILLSALRLPANAMDVAVDSNLGIAAAAADDGRLYLIDVANSTQPTLLQSVNVSDPQANAALDHVRVAGGVAYVSVGSSLRAVDLLSGQVLQTLPLPGASQLTGLAREGQKLYTMDAAETLRVVDLAGPQMVVRGSLKVPRTGGRVFAGNGVAYLAAADSGFGGGYATVDVTDPDHPVLLAAPNSNPAIGFPNTTVAANGSGLALLAGTVPGPNATTTPVLDLLSTADPTTTTAEQTRLFLPAAPTDLAIASGLAFVTSGAGGLQVVRYLPPDTAGVPPAVSISMPATQVVEGSDVPVRVNVRDDVQVRNVELLVNGRVVQNSVSFPFDLTAVAPVITPQANTFTLQVRATDTGGDTTLSDVLTLGLVRDTSPLQIASINPADGQHERRNFRVVRIAFSKAVAADTITNNNFQVFDAKGNQVIPAKIGLTTGDRVVELFFNKFAPGDYRLVIHAAGVKDRLGSPLGTTDVVSRFTIDPYSILFTWNVSGDLMDARNWDLGRLPRPDDDAFIPSSFLGSVFLGSHDALSVASLTSAAPIALDGSLTVAGILEVDNALMLQGGTIHGATLVSTPQTQFVAGGANNLAVGGANLDGVTFQGDFDLSAFYTSKGPLLTFDTRSQITVNGTIRGLVLFIGQPGELQSAQSVLTGSGTLIDPHIDVYPRNSLTIGPNMTLRGAVVLGMYKTDTTIINQGTISVEGPSKDELLWSWDFDYNGSAGKPSAQLLNEGTFQIQNGARLLISSSFDFSLPGSRTNLVNKGTLHISGASVLELSHLLWSAPRTVLDNGSTVNFGFTELVTSPGQTSVLSGGGNWHFAFGLSGFLGGTVNLTDGAVLKGAPSLYGATLNGDVDASQNYQLPGLFGTDNSTYIGVTDDSAVNGKILLGVTAVSSGQLSFTGGSRLDGNADIEFTPGTRGTVYGYVNPALGSVKDADFAIGPGVTLRATNLTVASDVGTHFLNHGTIYMTGIPQEGAPAILGTLNLGAPFMPGSWSNPDGRIIATNATVNLTRFFRTQDIGSLTALQGSIVNITGTLDNTGTTLQLNADTGSWNLQGFQPGVGTGRIFGGTIATRDGARLIVTPHAPRSLELNAQLIGVTFDGELDLSTSPTVALETPTGFTLRGTLWLGTGGTLNTAGSPGAPSNYTQTASGNVFVTLAGPTAYGRLVVTDTATLDGTLTVSLAPGYAPKLGDQFTLLTYGSRIGRFAAITGLNLGNGLALEANYNPADLTLTVVRG